MKIAHEAPLDIFEMVQMCTDYDYALVHLFEESEEYLDKFIQAKQKGREVLLDNSIFELGEAFDSERYKYWIDKLHPDWYIIPDALEDAETTVKNVKEWSFDLPINKIGACQAKTYEEMVWCYKEIEPLVDKVAISFDFSFFNEWTVDLDLPTKYHEWMVGRQRMLKQLVNDGVINENKPHHLLGCGVPQEFKAYQKYKWISSLDTSNPVVAGIKGIQYTKEGLDDKPSQKLFTMINQKTTEDQILLIEHNMKIFRRFCEDEEMGRSF